MLPCQGGVGAKHLPINLDALMPTGPAVRGQTVLDSYRWSTRDTGTTPSSEWRESSRSSLEPGPAQTSWTQPVHPAIVPVGSQLSGLFPLTDVDASVTVPPELNMPPPWVAVLPLTWL